MNAQETKMTSSEIVAFTEAVKASAKTTNTIKSNFVQYKHLDFLSNDIKTSGNMAFKSPDLVKWQYTDPYEYTIVFKGTELLINDGGTKSNVDLGSSKLFKKLNELIVNSVKGNMFQDDDFSITYFKTPDYNKAIFIPKDEKILEYIAQFELHFNKKDAQVLEVKMLEPSQDFTRILFEDRVLNTTISDAVFTN